MRARLRATLKALGTLPEGFEVHPKLLPFVRKRAELAEGRGEADWAIAESLAWGTLLLEGVPVRLSGQDSGRGTFSQRHAVLHDVRTQKEYVPLNAVATAGASFEVYDSLLSETAVMGFEYGYSVAEHRTLVMWEAQFGDFVNGAQVIVDQFLAGSETKWGQPSGLVLLLPHGHEGQGPEHSSARIERFLTLCAEGNLRVAYPSTPASYFHLLRAQARDPLEKPLVVFTPKSLLRHPRCVSPLDELAEGGFQPVIGDRVDPARVRRVVFCTGKVYYDLLKAREDAKRDDVALVRLEALYPFPVAEVEAELARYSPQAELVWCQEEPRNMGAWRFVRERFLDGDVAASGRVPLYAGRAASASPAPGQLKVHVTEQEALVQDALRLAQEPTLAPPRPVPSEARPAPDPSQGRECPPPRRRYNARNGREPIHNQESGTRMATIEAVPARRREILESAVIRFAGDSGDGMQITGSQFTNTTALFGNDLATFPDYPAEIRAPAGTLPGVSGFQIHFGASDVYTPGRRRGRAGGDEPRRPQGQPVRPEGERHPDRQHGQLQGGRPQEGRRRRRTRWRTDRSRAIASSRWS